MAWLAEATASSGIVRIQSSRDEVSPRDGIVIGDRGRPHMAEHAERIAGENVATEPHVPAR